MKSAETVGAHLKYGRELIHSGLSGLRTGSESYLHGRPLPDALGQTAFCSLSLALIGACVGILPLSIAKHHRTRKSVAVGALGCAIGFCAAFAWKTRDLTRSMTVGARRCMEATSDQHWLESHPIDYA